MQRGVFRLVEWLSGINILNFIRQRDNKVNHWIVKFLNLLRRLLKFDLPIYIFFRSLQNLK